MDVLAHRKLIRQFFDVFDGIGAGVAGEGPGLPDGVDVAHVPDGGLYLLVLVFDRGVDLFIGGVGLGDEVVFVEVGVVWSGWVGQKVPNPLKEYLLLKSRGCKWRVTALMITIIYQQNHNPNLCFMIIHAKSIPPQLAWEEDINRISFHYTSVYQK